MEHHAKKHHNTANILSKTDYNRLKVNLDTSPMFIWPVQRKGGHFLLLSQYQK